MNKVKDIIKILDNISNFSIQEKWDNSSLNVGSLNQEVKNIVISLDIDKNIIKEIKNNTLFITHHPTLMTPTKNINTDFYPNNLIREIIKTDSSHIAMHTNFDKTHLNRYVFENILGFKIVEEKDFVCYGDIKGINLCIQNTVKPDHEVTYIKLLSVLNSHRPVYPC